MDGLISADTEQSKSKQELNEENAKFQQETLNLLKEGNYALIIDMMNKVTEKYPELFFNSDTEYQNQYKHYTENFKTGAGDEDYYKFIERVVKPFWRKVNEADDVSIPDEYFAPVRTIF